jgi:hypothetical protein
MSTSISVTELSELSVTELSELSVTELSELSLNESSTSTRLSVFTELSELSE